jgi:DNA-binding NarL/FixJ family response regulator
MGSRSPRRWFARPPGAAVLLVSSDDHPHHAERLEASGARGFLLKSQLVVADLAASR